MRKIGYYAIVAFIAITGCTKEEFSGNGSIKGNYTLKVEIISVPLKWDELNN